MQIAEQNIKGSGFDSGPVDGAFTAQTEAAIRAFQERRGLLLSGILDDATKSEPILRI
jgi:peptidoglycan hydrolase-like protein with peptidoglycan-binding domain